MLMDFIINFFSAYFTARTPLQSFIEGIIFIIGMYGIFNALLFFIRYYLLYTIVQKLRSRFPQIKFRKNQYIPPSEKEDELLRDKEAEREKAEKVEVERMGQESSIEDEFRILLPNAVGKWQKFVLGQRQDLILAIAQRMQAGGNTGFWKTLVEVQREAARGIVNLHNRERRR
jgi:predicted ATP-dependent protease